jgi:hypothetical protein
MNELRSYRDRFGRRISLTYERWSGHILILHPEMKALEHLVRRAIIHPDLIAVDRDYPNREVFYTLNVAGTLGNRHVKVCVEFRSKELEDKMTEGIVVTAYITRQMKRGETPIWQRES